MENNNGHQVPGNNDVANNIDLTLRLGLPFYDRLRLEDNNRRGQHGQGNLPIQLAAPVGMGNIGGPPPGPDPANYALFLVGGVKVCHSCGRINTPLWRRGPGGRQTLCNACGLRHARIVRRNVDG